MEKSYLEKKILHKIDELIEIIINLSSSKSYSKDEALEKATKLIPILLDFLNGSKIHVEPLFFQLIFERIPDRNILTSFGNFQDLLNEIISESCKNYFDSGDIGNISLETNNFTEKEKSDYSINNFKKIIFKIYPLEKISFDYYFRGFKFNAYIPEKKIAIVINENNKKISRLRYFCEKLGIRLIILTDTKNYREIKKNIVNQLTGNL